MKKTLQMLLFGMIALFLVFSLTKNIFSYKDKVRFHSELQAEYDEEKALNKELKSEVRKSSDYYYVERQIRNKLNLLQEDEVSIIIPEITPSPTPTPVVEKQPYEQWAELFTNR